MSSISFSKYQATGNDFILIDDREGRFPVEDSALIQSLCHRKFGIGADGLILLQLQDDIYCAHSKNVNLGCAKTPRFDDRKRPCIGLMLGRLRSSILGSFRASPNSHFWSERNIAFRMRIFNRDGYEAESCGNGLRCLLTWLRELHIAKERTTIHTQGRVVEGFFQEGLPVIEMGQVREVHSVKMELGLIHCVNTGVPHGIQFVKDVDAIDVSTTGLLLRNRLQANVNFASIQSDGSICVRTFERGVEGETLSCGTGAVAVAYISSCLFGLSGVIPIRFRGGTVKVWQEEGKLFLAGPAQKVFAGIREPLA